jgi:class 3 adenylate cyclase
MHGRWVTLHFPESALEESYQAFLAQGRVQNARFAILVAFVLNIVYTVWDRQVFSAHLHDVTLFREVVMNAFLCILFAATFNSRLKKHAGSVVAFGTFCYALFFATINVWEPTPYIFIANGILIFIFPYLFISGQLSLAVTTALASSAAFLGVLSTVRAVDRDFVILTLLVIGTNFMGFCFAVSLDRTRRREFMARTELDKERQRFRSLLVRVLPDRIADRLQREEVVADVHAQVAVVFADVVGFTSLASQYSPRQVVAWLNNLFAEFDRVIDKHGLEKIKTIGDAYMAAHGLGDDEGDCTRCAFAALELAAVASRQRRPDGRPVQIRVGMHVGAIVAGIIGEKRFLYDLWGDTVNVASRMESAGLPGAVLVTDEVERVLRHRFDLEECPAREIKGKGMMRTWLLRGLKGAEGLSS